MITVVLLCVGRLKESHLREGVAEYAKRLGAYCDFRIVEVADSRIPEDPSPAEADKVLETEGRLILDRIPKNARVVVLAVEGGMITSPEFAGLLAETADRGTSTVCFVIGGSLGLSAEVKRAADVLLSFSRMTFPHQLMRLIAAEQIYRAFTILNHRTYHK